MDANVDGILGACREAREQLGSMLYGGREPLDVPVLVEGGRAYWGLNQAVTSLEKIAPGASPVLQVEARVVEAPVAARIPEPSSPLAVPEVSAPRVASRAEGKERAPRGVLKSVILEGLRSAPMPPTKKELCNWIEKKRAKEVSHVMNLGQAVYQSLRKMWDAGEIEERTDGDRTVYRLPD